jgi:hypothetical protein
MKLFSITVVFKLLTLSFIWVSSMRECSNSQCKPCGKTGELVKLFSQEGVNEFQASLPKGCTAFLGDIQIVGSDIKTISPLSFLTSVGSLEILASSTITNIDGLKNLDTVIGNLSITVVSGLENLDGLKSLDFIGGDLYLSRLDLLKSLTGLNNLTTVGGNLLLQRYIYRCTMV